MQQKQIEWASRHDWFVKDNGDGSILCLDISVNLHTGKVDAVEVTFNNFGELKSWAGY